MELFWFLYVVVFCFGAIIGSFLNVVIYRLHTGRSVNGRSHCLTCGTHLKWYELFPIFSYLALGAKCRSCSAYIPNRYLFVEVLTALSFTLMWYLFSGTPFLFIMHTVLIAGLSVLAIYDVRHTIIPDELTIIVGAIAVILLGYQYSEAHAILPIIYDCIGGLSAALFFGGLWYVSGGKWLGFGDAKLALPLAVIVGSGGVFSMIVLSFWIGAVLSLIFIGLQRLLQKGKTSLLFLPYPLTIKSEVPFAPFLVLGFLLVHLLHADIFSITFFLVPL